MRRLFALLIASFTLPSAADQAIVNPQPVSKTVTLAGALSAGAADTLDAQGIRVVVDLRTPEEGTEAERIELEARGFQYINFPTTGFPDHARRLEFAALMDGLVDTPVLVHCASGNRAGMLWGLYRFDRGADPATVMAEIAPVVTRAELRSRIAETVGAPADTP